MSAKQFGTIAATVVTLIVGSFCVGLLSFAFDAVFPGPAWVTGGFSGAMYTGILIILITKKR
jgi:hypothetical protein